MLGHGEISGLNSRPTAITTAIDATPEWSRQGGFMRDAKHKYSPVSSFERDVGEHSIAPLLTSSTQGSSLRGEGAFKVCDATTSYRPPKVLYRQSSGHLDTSQWPQWTA